MLCSAQKALNVEFGADALPAFVISHGKQLLAKLCLSMGFELLECRKCVALRLQQHRSAQARAVVDEGDPVAVARVYTDMEWPMDIRMDEPEWLRGSIERRGEWSSIELAYKAWLTDRIHGLARLHHYTLYQISSDEFLDISLVQMAETTMPKRLICIASADFACKIAQWNDLAIQESSIVAVDCCSE